MNTPKSRPCVRCGGSLPPHSAPQRKWCPPCYQEHRNERRREERALAPANRSRPRTKTKQEDATNWPEVTDRVAASCGPRTASLFTMELEKLQRARARAKRAPAEART